MSLPMTSRRRLNLPASSRPISAIYLGSGPNPLQSLPALPDPPSPLVSPFSSTLRTRQLPSPPATNSTGSGSTGDAASSNTDSIGRQNDMHNEIYTQQQQSHEKQLSDDDDNELDLDDDDEDHTAKLSSEIQFASQSDSKGESTLARVKSLTERNRQLSRRLSSIASTSRQNTPSPPLTDRSRDSFRNKAHPPLAPLPNSSIVPSSPLSQGSFSGSETEREPVSRSSHLNGRHISEAEAPSTPPPVPRALPPSPHASLLSAPSSSGKPPLTPAMTGTRSKKAPRTRRVSNGVGDKEPAHLALGYAGSDNVSREGAWEGDQQNMRSRTYSLEGTLPEGSLTAGRKSPQALNRRLRQPLPREFRDVAAFDGASVSEYSVVSSTKSYNTGRLSPDFHQVARRPPSSTTSSRIRSSTATPSSRPPRSAGRSATLRETSRPVFHHARAESDDLHSFSIVEDAVVGRRQTQRAGSAESTLGGRSIVGEGLKAAGLANRRRDDDVFGVNEDSNERRTRLNFGSQAHTAGVEEAVILGSGDASESIYTSSRARRYESASEQAGGRQTTRPSSSLVAFRDERSPGTASSQLRSYKSTLQERASPLTSASNSRRSDYQTEDRALYTPPTPSHSRIGRHSSLYMLTANSNSSPTSEHAKLMLDSLSMFESHLARLPSSGNVSLSANTIPDLYRNAQSVVHSANTLNTLLREANAHALEEQIEAEIREGGERLGISEVWRTVGSEYRESLRVSDELVRTMTGFFLGMGRILREATTPRENRVDESGRTASPNESQGSASRRSTDGRRSLELRPSDTSPRERERERNRDESLRRIATHSSTRPPSVLDSFPSPGPEETRGVESDQEKPQRVGLSGLSVRKLFVPKSQRLGSPLSAAPSPITGNRQRAQSRHSTSMLVSPAPLPMLPSESQPEPSGSGNPTRRSRGSSTSVATVRAGFPSISTSQPTTAVTTTTVSNSAQKTPFPLLRSSSTKHEGTNISRESSTSSNLDQERMAAVISPAEPSIHVRRNREQTQRLSFDDTRQPEQSTFQRTYSERRDRRRTVAEIFSRDTRA